MFSQRPKPSQFHKFHQIISGMTIRMASTQHKKSRSKKGTALLLPNNLSYLTANLSVNDLEPPAAFTL